MLDFLFNLRLWQLALLLNLVLCGTAITGVWAYRKYLLPRMRIGPEDSDYSGAVTQSIMVCYGLIAALTAVKVWDRYTQVEAVASSEATAIGALYRDFGGYPSPLREKLKGELRAYTDQVIQRAWPEMKHGRVPAEGVLLIDRLQESLFSFEPVTEAQKLIHAETLRAYNHMVILRRQRVDAAKTALPDVLWVVLMPGAFACIVLSLFYRIEEPKLQYVCTVGLAGFISMVLFVIFALDRPFVGDMAIEPESYRLIFDQLMK